MFRWEDETKSSICFCCYSVKTYFYCFGGKMWLCGFSVKTRFCGFGAKIRFCGFTVKIRFCGFGGKVRICNFDRKIHFFFVFGVKMFSVWKCVFAVLVKNLILRFLQENVFLRFCYFLVSDNDIRFTFVICILYQGYTKHFISMF